MTEARMTGENRPLWNPAPVHHILHKYQAGTANYWPGRADVVIGSNRFSPHL